MFVIPNSTVINELGCIRPVWKLEAAVAAAGAAADGSNALVHGLSMQQVPDTLLPAWHPSAPAVAIARAAAAVDPPTP